MTGLDWSYFINSFINGTDIFSIFIIVIYLFVGIRSLFVPDRDIKPILLIPAVMVSLIFFYNAVRKVYKVSPISVEESICQKKLGIGYLRNYHLMDSRLKKCLNKDSYIREKAIEQLKKSKRDYLKKIKAIDKRIKNLEKSR